MSRFSGGNRFSGPMRSRQGLASSISNQFAPAPVQQKQPRMRTSSPSPATPAPMPSPQAPPPPVPGVSGITPGAIERRVSGPPPSLGLQGAPPLPPSAALRNFNPGLVRNKPNLAGPARGEINAPVANIQQFLQNLRNQRGPQ